MTNLLQKRNKLTANVPVETKVSLAYLLCTIIQRGIGFFTVPIFTRMLTEEQYGESTLFYSWSSVLTVLITLQLPYGSFSKAMVKYEDKRAEYVSSTQSIITLLAIAFLIIYFPLSGFWNDIFKFSEEMILFMVLEIVSLSSILLWSGKKRFEYKYKSVIAVTLLCALLTPAMQLLFIFLCDQKGLAKIKGGVVVSIVIGGIIYIVNLIKGKKIFDKEFWKYSFSFNVPLLAYYLSQMIFNESDRIMISHMEGVDRAAEYGVAYSLATIIIFVLNAINNTYTPWIYSKIKDGKHDENRDVSAKIAIILAVLLLVVIWLGPEVIEVWAGKSYASAKWVVPPVAMSVLLLFFTQQFAYFEFFYEKKAMLIVASVISAIVNIILNYVFIGKFGYIAAGYTTLISYIIMASITYFGMRRIEKEFNYERSGVDIWSFIKIAIVFFAISFMGMCLYDWFLPRIIGICIFVIIFLLKVKLLLKGTKANYG